MTDKRNSGGEGENDEKVYPLIHRPPEEEGPVEYPDIRVTREVIGNQANATAEVNQSFHFHFEGTNPVESKGTSEDNPPEPVAPNQPKEESAKPKKQKKKDKKEKEKEKKESTEVKPDTKKSDTEPVKEKDDSKEASAKKPSEPKKKTQTKKRKPATKSAAPRKTEKPKKEEEVTPSTEVEEPTITPTTEADEPTMEPATEVSNITMTPAAAGGESNDNPDVIRMSDNNRNGKSNGGGGGGDVGDGGNGNGGNEGGGGEGPENQPERRANIYLILNERELMSFRRLEEMANDANDESLHAFLITCKDIIEGLRSTPPILQSIHAKKINCMIWSFYLLQL